MTFIKYDDMSPDDDRLYCPRCNEWFEEQPDGCRDPDCPLQQPDADRLLEDRKDASHE